MSKQGGDPFFLFSHKLWMMSTPLLRVTSLAGDWYAPSQILGRAHLHDISDSLSASDRLIVSGCMRVLNKDSP